MANAKHDENSRPTLICASSADGVTIVPIQCVDSSHKIKVIDGIAGANNGNNSGNTMLDENGSPVWTALSSTGDGSIVEIYGDAATGAVLIQTT